MEISYETVKRIEDELSQTQSVLAQLIEELRQAKVIKEPKEAK